MFQLGQRGQGAGRGGPAGQQLGGQVAGVVVRFHPVKLAGTADALAATVGRPPAAVAARGRPRAHPAGRHRPERAAAPDGAPTRPKAPRSWTRARRPCSTTSCCAATSASRRRRRGAAGQEGGRGSRAGKEAGYLASGCRSQIRARGSSNRASSVAARRRLPVRRASPASSRKPAAWSKLPQKNVGGNSSSPAPARV